MIFILLACTTTSKDSPIESSPSESATEQPEWRCTGAKLISLEVGMGLVCGIDEAGCLGCMNIEGASTRTIPNTPPDGLFQQVSLAKTSDTSNYDYYPGYGCALDINGYVQCWGEDMYGETEPPLEIFTSISVGREFACGILENEQLRCWGRINLPTSEQTYQRVEAGLWSVCALTNEGVLDCWDTSFGGAESETMRLPYTVSIFDIEMGTCILDSTGAIDCWAASIDSSTKPPSVVYPDIVGTDLCTMGFDKYCILDLQGQIVCDEDYGIDMNVSLTSLSWSYANFCGLTETNEGRCWSTTEGIFSIP